MGKYEIIQWEISSTVKYKFKQNNIGTLQPMVCDVIFKNDELDIKVDWKVDSLSYSCVSHKGDDFLKIDMHLIVYLPKSHTEVIEKESLSLYVDISLLDSDKELIEIDGNTISRSAVVFADFCEPAKVIR